MNILTMLDPVVRDPHSGAIVGHDADIANARAIVADLIRLGSLLVREREAMGAPFTPDWQLFRDAIERAK